jgi:hypothetical protein
MNDSCLILIRILGCNDMHRILNYPDLLQLLAALKVFYDWISDAITEPLLSILSQCLKFSERIVLSKISRLVLRFNALESHINLSNVQSFVINYPIAFHHHIRATTRAPFEAFVVFFYLAHHVYLLLRLQLIVLNEVLLKL